MASLISDSEKSSLNEVMNDHHDTFARPVVVIQDPIKTVPEPNSSFNSIYRNAGATTPVVFTPQEFTIQARIEYGSSFGEDYFSNSQSPNQLKIDIPDGLVRMKIKASDYGIVSEAKRVRLDNQEFSIYSDFRGHRLFYTQFYTIMLKKIS